jgi:hypothetical protein
MIGGKQLLMCDISSAELKEKGTNERININWETNKENSQGVVAFCYNPSITLGYRINEWLALGLDINYWLSNVDFEYIEETINASVPDIQIKRYKYSTLLNEISFGLGVMVTF